MMGFIFTGVMLLSIPHHLSTPLTPSRRTQLLLLLLLTVLNFHSTCVCLFVVVINFGCSMFLLSERRPERTLSVERLLWRTKAVQVWECKSGVTIAGGCVIVQSYKKET